MRYMEFTSKTEAEQYAISMRGCGYRALVMTLNQKMYEVRGWA